MEGEVDLNDLIKKERESKKRKFHPIQKEKKFQKKDHHFHR